MKTVENKKLWEYDNWSCFEVEHFHHTPVYGSWEEFISDKGALTCNCISDSPLLYWYWDNGVDEPCEDFEFDKTNMEENKQAFKRIVLIYRYWIASMEKIEIRVTHKDEPKIRKFIFGQQRNQRVFF